MAASAGTRRDRLREQTRAEAKAIALRQIAESGPGALSLNAIAREMGMTGPALYRYFASRDDLLSELVIDGYDDLADEVERALQSVAGASCAERLRTVAMSVRAWALAQPHRYLLLFGTPVAGYDAPPEALQAARRTMSVLIAAQMQTEDPTGVAFDRLDTQFIRWAAHDEQIAHWLASVAGSPDNGAALRRGVVLWTRLHGVIGLEVAGHFAGMEFDPATLLDAELTLLSGERDG
jgi:AcrR family transcriptional regulator